MTLAAAGGVPCLPGGARIIFLSKQGWRSPLVSALAEGEVSSYQMIREGWINSAKGTVDHRTPLQTVPGPLLHPNLF